MKVLLSLNFFIFAAIQFGLLLGILHYLRSGARSRPNPYWISALVTNVLGLTCFAIGILYTDDIQNPPEIFTVANTLFFAAALCQGLFFYSLNHAMSLRLKWLLGLSIILYALIFEYLRQTLGFQDRTLFAVCTYAVILVWQILESRLINKTLGLQQLRYFQYAAIGEAIFLVPRLLVLITSENPFRAIDQLPQLLIIFTFAQILMNTLSFIAIWGYWSEKLALDSRQTETQNEAFKKLLDERETLIASLLKANKSSTTGALSASIAHEINQPLGAIQINSEFLQKKLQEEVVDHALINRLADDIVKDNMRAARIIRTLKAIFSEEHDAIPDQVAVTEVLDSVLLLSKSDLQQKQIQVEIEITNNLYLPMSFGEAQQLFLNLLNNSVQALEKTTQINKIIRIVGKQSAEHISVRIEDNGPGVLPEQEKSLFDLFSGSKREGMGLGLWLCNYIITRHSGRIRYDAQHHDGAAFEIVFPSS
jgi:C4-dicarboxylate-specific signal transduction histidine kinase